MTKRITKLGEKDSEFIACPSCADARSEKRFASALNCTNCKGFGAIRTSASYICNRCGDSLMVGSSDHQSLSGAVDTVVSGGYYSEHLLDGHSYKFSLCEKCLRELFNEFKIVPTVHNYIHDESATYEQDVAYMLKMKLKER